MLGEANTLRSNIQKEYDAFKHESDLEKINAFYTKITKLVDFVPFTRQMQLKFGIDKRVDQVFVEVMHDLKKIVDETKMAERGVIDAFEGAPLVTAQIKKLD